ncbi:DUF5683 domain-containing protein [Robiginitalea sp. SC105]|uniref:DUF5683 domain-containing protein n=1 Tax=Robiginitalea sp. SC105 TaxID=2762332 RepID=UPI002101FFE0|nr:DUF5683 domain-containing protein [Robiginitalea sp. SC105]
MFLLLAGLGPGLQAQETNAREVPQDSLARQQVADSLALEQEADSAARQRVADSLRNRDEEAVQRQMAGSGIRFEKVEKQEINPLAPSKAAFFSAVLPGLGQIYNRRYWKAPIVWAAIGTGTYVYIYNDDLYDRFRTAFKRRRAGFTDDEFYDLNKDDNVTPTTPDFSDEALQDAQERYQRDRDLALLITIGLYALNIIDANVDAHLKQYNVDEDLSMEVTPYLETNPINGNPHYGLAVNLRF